MKSIYFRNREVTICGKESPAAHDKNATILSPADDYELTSIPLMMEANTNLGHLVVTENEKYSQEEIYRQIVFKLQKINAGGGLITNSEGKYLMILRRGVWDLPKGKQEEGESIELTSQREVEEEVGLKCILGDAICTTHHIYRLEKHLVLKDTYWYSMQYNGNQAPVPQTIEQIERCEWCSPSEVAFNLQNSYASIVEVFAKAGII